MFELALYPTAVHGQSRGVPERIEVIREWEDPFKSDSAKLLPNKYSAAVTPRMKDFSVEYYHCRNSDFYFMYFKLKLSNEVKLSLVM